MELLAPAGNIDKLRYAVWYGADAVYIGGKSFSLRAKSGNFDNEEMTEAVNFCHQHNVKVFVTLNIYAHNEDLPDIPEYIQFLQSIKVDAVIVSDPAVFMLVKEYGPEISIHISTQANTTSWRSVKFWKDLGATRIILARELSFIEIKEIRKMVPDIELEMFVHGAMCIAYSGRCLLSAFLNQRDANRGNCSQPCRWQYQLVEESRPGQYFPIEEDDRGTYILNSKDLALINRIKELNEIGIDSLKIEGRMKSLYYVANVTRIYRKAIDELSSESYDLEKMHAELDKISHRIYTEAFFDGFDSSNTQNYATSSYIRNYQFIGNVADVDNNRIIIPVKAKFQLGDELEIIFPNPENDITIKVNDILDEEDNPIDFTKPNTVVKVKISEPIQPFGIVRKKIAEIK